MLASLNVFSTVFCTCFFYELFKLTYRHPVITKFSLFSRHGGKSNLHFFTELFTTS